MRDGAPPLVTPLIPGITFGTHCYEEDWIPLLRGDRLKRMIDLNNHDFAERKLFINNVKNPDEVEAEARALVEKGILTSVVVVENKADEALGFFGIEKRSFRGGYYYSIPHLVNIYLCSTEHILYFTADCCLVSSATWIKPCLERMSGDSSLKVAIPLWNGIEAARKEAESEEPDFFVGYGFSDQCYLVRTSDYRARIYNEWNRMSERYPPYGGELWEKRVDSWMRNHRYRRLTYKHASYLHRKFH